MQTKTEIALRDVTSSKPRSHYLGDKLRSMKTQFETPVALSHDSKTLVEEAKELIALGGAYSIQSNLEFENVFLKIVSETIYTSISKIAKDALAKNMHIKEASKIGKILEVFANHSMQKSHARHISSSECKEAGLEIVEMEADNELQDLILTVHHAFMHSFANSTAIKIVENHLGIAYVEVMSMPQLSE